MTTNSGMGLYRWLRARLLSHVSQDGVTLQTLLSGRLYIVQAPAPPVYPFGVLSLVNMEADGAYNSIRKTGDLELMLWDKGEANRVRVEQCADVAEEALFRLWADAPGLIFSRQSRRDSLPPAPDVIDAQAVAVRLVFPVVVWPRMLTRYDS